MFGSDARILSRWLRSSLAAASAACGGVAFAVERYAGAKLGEIGALVAAIACAVVVYVTLSRTLGLSNLLRPGARMSHSE